MLHQILSFLGWVGTALVFGAVVVRLIRPEWDQYATWSAWGGLALVVAYTLGQWREVLEYFQRRQARYSAVATVGGQREGSASCGSFMYIKSATRR